MDIQLVWRGSKENTYGLRIWRKAGVIIRGGGRTKGTDNVAQNKKAREKQGKGTDNCGNKDRGTIKLRNLAVECTWWKWKSITNNEGGYR